MATNTTNFNIVLPEGSDTFNPLTFNNNAFSLIDEQMKKNQDAGITTATHTFIDGSNTILRTIGSCNMLVFVASADYVAGSTIAVDGVTCTLRYADGTAPKSNAFRTNQAVLCYLNGTILTLISAKASVEDALIGNLDDLETDEKNTIVGAVNEVVDDVTELSSKLIQIEENEFGLAIMYPNGVMECVRSVEITVSCTNQWGALYFGENNNYWNFAKEFIDIPNVEVSITPTSSNSCWQIYYGKPIISKYSYSGIAIARPTSNQSVPIVAHIRAVGRWKASDS